MAITHIEDVASLIACAVGKESAMNQIFNCGTDKYISYNDLVKVHDDDDRVLIYIVLRALITVI